VQKYKAYFIVGTICFILGSGVSIWAVYSAIDGHADSRIKTAESKFNTDRDTLQKRLDDASIKVADATSTSETASRELAEYRKLIDQRERDRAKRIAGIIGQASQSGSEAKEISDGLTGDIELARRIEDRCSQLIEGLRRLQKSK
jgi:hypothetical protein